MYLVVYPLKDNILYFRIVCPMGKPRQTNLSLLLDKLSLSLDCTRLRFVSMLTQSKSNALLHLPDRDAIIERVWNSSAALTFLMLRSNLMRKLILSTHASHRGNNWMTLLDKLNICSNVDLNMLPMYLLQMLLLESISREKVCKPYWTPAYKELSEKLWLPTETDCVVSDLNSLNHSLLNPAAKSPFLTMTETKAANRNSQKTSFQLSTSTLANKWAKEVIPTYLLKSVKIKLKPSVAQKKILNEWITTSNYVYNKTVEEIYKKKHPVKFELLRDKLVTANTKKYNEEYTKATTEIKRLYVMRNKYKEIMKLFIRTRRGSLNIMKIKQAIAAIDENVAKERKKQKVLPVEKNMGIREWELRTPKEVRAGAVDDVCKAIKTGYANIKNGNIKHFRLKFRKRTEPNKCILVPKSFVKNNNGSIQIAPQFFKEHCVFKMGNRTKKKHGNIQINNDTRIVRQRKEYWIIIPVPVVIQNKKPPNTYCGIDPGVRTFMTLFGNNGVIEYKCRNEILKKLDTEIKRLKDNRITRKNRIRKERIVRLESRKDNLINELHWKTINNIVRNNDFIFYGNINSHNIVKNGKNRTLNREVNNLKFYKFKERLLYKAHQYGNKVYLVNEAHTSKTCSCCGCITEVGSSKIYTCRGCKRVIDRDINSGKNILMKGIITNE